MVSATRLRFDEPLHADMPPIPIVKEFNVIAAGGPSDIECLGGCGLLMFPQNIVSTLRGHLGLEEWCCFPCQRGVRVTWGVAL